MVERWIGTIGRHRRLLLIAWVILAGVAAVGSRPLPNLLSGGGWFVDGSQSARVAKELRTGFVGRGRTTVTLIVRDNRYHHGSADFAARVDRVVRTVAANKTLAVASRYGFADAGAASRSAFLGRDRRTVLEFLGLRLDDGTAWRVMPGVQGKLTRAFAPEGLSVTIVGESAFWGEITHLSEQRLVTAEMTALPLLVVILLLLYGSVAAALTSLAVAASAIAFACGVLTPVAEHMELSVFVQNTATMLGLGIGIDYSLFIVSRFKEEVGSGRAVEDALAITLRTSGETVLASGVTVGLAVATLFLVPLSVVRSIALGGILVVVFSVLVALLLLPVLLLTLGHRIEFGRVSAGRRFAAARGRHWYVAAQWIMRQPVLVLAVSVCALGALTLPAVRLSTFTPDARILPASSPVRSGYDQVRAEFDVGYANPIQVVLDAHAPLRGRLAQQVARFRASLRALPGVVGVQSALDVADRLDPRRPGEVLDPAYRSKLPADAQRTISHFATPDGRRLIFEVIPAGQAASPPAERALKAVRGLTSATRGPWTVAVGGETAEGIDSNRVIQRHLPVVVVVMLVAVYIVLLVNFGSVFLPLKAILINLLSLGATYGVLVLVFQDGFGLGLFGGTDHGQVQNFVPVLLLALLVSLSTDYEIFLLNRIREEYLRTSDNTDSVARGLARTAPLISGAALLMIAVFASFAATSILPVQQLGLGMAVAIALDATIIRLIVVPAAMRLMGRWNWWMPKVARGGLPRHAIPEEYNAAGRSPHPPVSAQAPDRTNVG